MLSCIFNCARRNVALKKKSDQLHVDVGIDVILSSYKAAIWYRDRKIFLWVWYKVPALVLVVMHTEVL